MIRNLGFRLLACPAPSHPTSRTTKGLLRRRSFLLRTKRIACLLLLHSLYSLFLAFNLRQSNALQLAVAKARRLPNSLVFCILYIWIGYFSPDRERLIFLLYNFLQRISLNSLFNKTIKGNVNILPPLFLFNILWNSFLSHYRYFIVWILFL